MQLIDLFSGFGAFSLAGKQVWGDELEILGFSEIEEYPIKVYEKNFPGVKSLGDIKELDGRTIKFSGPYIITGGFPCPPFSNAGHRKGQADDRFIWPEMVRIISEAKPTWVVAENVLGIISMGIDDCLADLGCQNYETELFVLPACGLGAIHKRNRIFLIAHTKGNGEPTLSRFFGETPKGFMDPASSDTNINVKEMWGNLSGMGWVEQSVKKYRTENIKDQPRILGMDDGFPNRLDQVKGLGNSIYIPILIMIFECIKQIENIKKKGEPINTLLD